MNQRIPGAALVWVSLAIAACAHPATLGLVSASESGSPAATITVPVNLATESSESVAGIQFDLHYDPTTLEFAAVDTGPSARDAEKSTHSNLLTPGKLRVIIAGLNRNIMTDGQVCLILFHALDGESPTTSATLENGVLSDPFGSPIPLTLSPQTLVLEQRNGNFRPVLATGASIPDSGPADPYGSFRAIIIALICVFAAIFWTRKAPKKGRGR